MSVQRTVVRGRSRTPIIRFEWMVCWLVAGRYRERKFALIQHSQAWRWFKGLCGKSDAVTIYQRAGHSWQLRDWHSA